MVLPTATLGASDSAATIPIGDNDIHVPSVTQTPDTLPRNGYHNLMVHSDDVSHNVGQDVQVDNFTNWGSFLDLLLVSFWSLVDAVLWTALDVAVTSVFVFVAPVRFVAEPVVNSDNRSRKSSATLDIPAFYSSYCQNIVAVSNAVNSVAKLFLHLSSVVFEPNDVLQAFVTGLKKTVPDLEHRRFGHEGCCCLAVYSVSRNFLVLVFKGTSRYDLAEWLTDASIRKSDALNDILPGMVHTFKIRGAYTFGTPQVGDQHFKDAIESAMKQRTDPLFQFYRVINASDVGCTLPATAGAQAIGNFLYRQKQSHRLRSALQYPSTISDTQPTGVTLLDFKHIGEPVLLGLRDGSIRATERGFLREIGFLLRQAPCSFHELVFNPDGNTRTWLDKATLVADICTLGTFGLVKNHYLSEYLTNLRAAETKHRDGPVRSEY
ncbi:hypothetical protein HK405_006575 [Cladochytrium tenue]|nr:hypothetical protein HK405_006575 [Cladochytrium tenue]